MPAKKTTKATPKEQAAPAAEETKAQAADEVTEAPVADADEQAAPAAEDATVQAADEVAEAPVADADKQAEPAAEDATVRDDAEHDLIIAEVVEKFRDKETGSVLKAGTIIAVPPARFDELEAAGVAMRLEA